MFLLFFHNKHISFILVLGKNNDLNVWFIRILVKIFLVNFVRFWQCLIYGKVLISVTPKHRRRIRPLDKNRHCNYSFHVSLQSFELLSSLEEK
jgi:hypothetical protein